MKDKSWEYLVEHAEQYKALDQIEHYLSTGRYPWLYATSCEPGGSHRLDIATSVYFRAKHPCGLEFRWNFDIEDSAANGKGHYEINVAGIRSIFGLLPDSIRRQFSAYLGVCAVKVRENANKYREIANREIYTAETLADLAGTEEVKCQ